MGHLIGLFISGFIFLSLCSLAIWAVDLVADHFGKILITIAAAIGLIWLAAEIVQHYGWDVAVNVFWTCVALTPFLIGIVVWLLEAAWKYREKKKKAARAGPAGQPNRNTLIGLPVEHPGMGSGVVVGSLNGKLVLRSAKTRAEWLVSPEHVLPNYDGDRIVSIKIRKPEIG